MKPAADSDDPSPSGAAAHAGAFLHAGARALAGRLESHRCRPPCRPRPSAGARNRAAEMVEEMAGAGAALAGVALTGVVLAGATGAGERELSRPSRASPGDAAGAWALSVRRAADLPAPACAAFGAGALRAGGASPA